MSVNKNIIVDDIKKSTSKHIYDAKVSGRPLNFYGLRQLLDFIT